MVFLDIETTTFFQDEHIKALPRDQQIAAMEFGIAVTIDSSEQSQRVWTKDQVVDLYNYLVWCGVEVCGWNIDAISDALTVNGEPVKAKYEADKKIMAESGATSGK